MGHPARQTAWQKSTTRHEIVLDMSSESSYVLYMKAARCREEDEAMGKDISLSIASTTISKVTRVPCERALRLYPSYTGDPRVDRWRWNLQIRGPATKSNGADGADFMVATACCSVEDLRALRCAIDEMLTGLEKKTR